MAFKIADPVNDRARNVVRRHRYSITNFFEAGVPGEGFIITGGHTDEQIYGLYHGIRDFMHRNYKPVVIFHNTPELDLVLRENLQKHITDLRYECVGNGRKMYMPFDGMSKRHVVNTMIHECAGMNGVNQLKIGQYMDSLLTILEQYKNSNALCYISEICKLTDAEIIQLAERAGLNRMVCNGIQHNTEAGMEIREIIRRLEKSASSICSYRTNHASWINIGKFLMQSTGNRVLSINIGGVDTDEVLMAMRDELSILNQNQFLLVFYDLGMNERNGMGELLANPQNRFTLGICSQDVAGMFCGNSSEYFQTVRARIKKWMFLTYTDAGAAAKVSNLFDSYMMEQTVDIKAPKKPWEIFYGKAPGKMKVKMEKLEPGELCEIDYGNAILYGHSGTTILFVTGKLDYNDRRTRTWQMPLIGI